MHMLNQMGWAEFGGLGATTLSSREVLAWCQGMGIELEPWEFELIRNASRAFARALAATDPREPNADDKPRQGGIAAALAATLNRRT